MKLTQRARGIVQAMAIILSLALPAMLAVSSSADARIGGGVSSGSRGSRTFSAPPSTSTAPSAAQPFNRTITQPGSPGLGAPAGGGFFNRPGMGLFGGLAAGFLGAGLLGMLFGGGMFGGLGGLSSIFGLILQIGLIVIVVRLAMSWWQRRHETAYAGAPAGGMGGQSNFRTGSGFGLGSGSAPIEIGPSDYEAFERLLGELQTAWSNEDIAKLHTLATPEMVSYVTRDIADHKAQNLINTVTNVKLLQGDLAEAWREGDTDFASVALRYSLIDKTVDRATGRLVKGSDQPTEVTEVWTFLRERGAGWELSAIQQT
ncbi:Tim44 domain-containing protein [Bradyrhizobium sp. dw_411]|uniref:Tim44 domain-containing protein n=1 Tax=Bradyrhizobium sp. dw_411 TaxID=2720082 RepID=UPI001BCCED6F|nr:Tim44 domain-containing protein [Bradyrhizobium sp. dw_411]